MSESVKVDMACSYCGSRDVMRDAWAEWDTEKQDWALRSVFDHAHCEVCDGDTTLSEVTLDETRLR